MRRNLRRWSDLVGDSLPETDSAFATFDPAPDLAEQFYDQKIAFITLLNFEKSTLDDMLAAGSDWDAARWAEARIAGSFGPRIPKEVADLARDLHFKSYHWVSNFHVPVGTMTDTTGRRWFESDRGLLAHWLIREEMKGGYNDPDGLHKQRALSWVVTSMEHSPSPSWIEPPPKTGILPRTPSAGPTPDRCLIWSGTNIG
jgi:hypothetical protein